ncbi:hypothetical protein ACVWWG_001208 [Bradyrhizobium sp. LB7.2]
MAWATARRAEFRRGERRKTPAASDAGGCPGEEDGTASARKHDTRCLASDQESGIAGQFPRLEEKLFRGVRQQLVDVRSGIEKADLDRSDILFDLGKELPDLGFLTSIDAERVNAVARSGEFIYQCFGFRRVTPADTNRIAAIGEPPGDGRADGVACANEYCHAAIFHPFLPLV